MRTLEDRTSAALHEVADGLPMSEHDVRRLEEDILARLETRPGEVGAGGRRRTWGAAAAVVLVLGGAALWQSGRDSAVPVPAGPSPSAEPAPVLPDPGLVGVWRNAPAEQWIWEITADGRITWNATTRDYFSRPRTTERFAARNGDVYDLLRDGVCLLRLQLRLTGTDSAVVTVIREDCPDPTPPGTEYGLERVSGRDPASPPLRPAYPRDAPIHAPAILRIAGTWVEPESGTLLVIDTWVGDETVPYLVDTNSDGLVAPGQRGTISMTDGGGTVVVPEQGTPEGCAPVFTAVRTDRATMTTTAGEGGCFPAGSTQTWIALN